MRNLNVIIACLQIVADMLPAIPEPIRVDDGQAAGRKI